MSAELAIVLLLLAAAIAMFAVGTPRMDAVALLMLTVLPLTGVIGVNDALAGFGDPNIVLLGALFAIGEGLVRTGVAQRLGDWLLRTAGSSSTRLLVLLMAAVGCLGAFMSSTGVVAIFIPVALRIAHNTGESPSQLLMPLSVAALISGMLTLVATAPNLVVNSELIRHSGAGFQFFSFTPFGIPILLLGIAYMLAARRWLASGGTEMTAPARPSFRDWIARYRLAGREHRVRVTIASPLVGRTVGELDLRSASGANIVALERRRGRALDIIAPTRSTEIGAGDILLVDLPAPSHDVDALCARLSLERQPLGGDYFSDLSQEIGMAEAIVGPDSGLVGQTLIQSEFRSRFGLAVIGLRRTGAALEHGLLRERLAVGDTLLLIGPWKRIKRAVADANDLVILNLPAEIDEVVPAPARAPHALFCVLLMVGLMVSGVVPNVLAALIACLLMGAFGCIDLDSAYRSIHWKSLILIVGMLPFAIALDRTGGVALAADGLLAIVGNARPHVVLGSLFAITALLGLFISNTATAVLMAPVALAIADQLGASPYPFAMIVALAASTAFMTPISSPVNTLVVGPGDYTFGDFLRVGVPLAVLVMLLCVLLVPWLLPL